MSKGKILFKLSGSIACYKACTVISRLVQSDFEVQVIATKSALEFVGAATLEGLSGRSVESDTFAPGKYMQHIHLAKWPDLTILCPASANTLNKMANGIGDDLLTTLFLAHDFSKPYFVAPAMNTLMYRHPATSHSLAKLKSYGVTVLETASGILACGDIGEGRLLEPDLIFQEIETFFTGVPTSSTHLLSEEQTRLGQKAQTKMSKPLDVLITSGGTKEPIDGVRAITNSSSGKTGASIADYFASKGHHVTLLKAKDSAIPSLIGKMQTKDFISFADLQNVLKNSLEKKTFDAVIHLAAVSDYSVDHLELDGKTLARPATESESLMSSHFESRAEFTPGKIESGKSLVVHLKQNPKIVDQIKSYVATGSSPVLVAFKLTNQASPTEQLKAVENLQSHSHADYVVQNDLSEISNNEGLHPTRIYRHDRLIAECGNKQDLAVTLEQLLLKVETQGSSL